MDEKISHLPETFPKNLRPFPIKRGNKFTVIIETADGKRIDYSSLPSHVRASMPHSVKQKVTEEILKIRKSIFRPDALIGYSCPKCEKTFTAAVLDDSGKVPSAAPCPFCKYPVANIQWGAPTDSPSYVLRFITLEEFNRLQDANKHYFRDGGLFLERI